MNNMEETIKYNNECGKNAMPVDEAKKLWNLKDAKPLTDKQLQEKTFSGIKLIEGLTARDKARKYFRPDGQAIQLEMKVGEIKDDGAEKKTRKVAPSSLWINVLDAGTSKVVLACTYRDFGSGLSRVVDGDGNELVSGKGWKQIRDFFNTADPSGKPKKTPAKAAKPKKSSVDNDNVDSEDCTTPPELPNELN